MKYSTKKIRYLTIFVILLSTLPILMISLHSHIYVKDIDRGSHGNILSQQIVNANLEELTSTSLMHQKNFADLSMEERKAFVSERCRNVKSWPQHQGEPDANVDVFVDKQYGLVACNNHKVGSTTINKILYKLRNTTKFGTVFFRKQVLRHVLAPKAINNFTFPSTMFVRDPLERLLSAYNDNRLVKNIKRKNGLFETFLTDVLNVADYKRINSHHLSYYNRCRPCDVGYDFYGTMDTYNDDLIYIFNRLGIRIDSVPHEKRRTMRRTTLDNKLINLPLKVKNAVWERYKEDYYIFGYPHPAVKYSRPLQNAKSLHLRSHKWGKYKQV